MEWKREGTVTEAVWVWNTTYSKMSMAELFFSLALRKREKNSWAGNGVN